MALQWVNLPSSPRSASAECSPVTSERSQTDTKGHIVYESICVGTGTSEMADSWSLRAGREGMRRDG